MNEKRFNCHVKFSKIPNGFMVLDYTKKGKEQTVIEDISREKAHSVMDRLNELSDENEQLKDALNQRTDQCDKYYKENEQLKKQLREEQYRTTPITLTTTISDDDFKKIELMLKKYFGDLE